MFVFGLFVFVGGGGGGSARGGNDLGKKEEAARGPGNLLGEPVGALVKAFRAV